MTLAERLKASKGDIVTVLEAFRLGDASNVTVAGNSLVAELAGLDDLGWDGLLENLEDSELREQVELLRQIVKEKAAVAAVHDIRQVRHSASFKLSPPGLTIGLTFKAREETLATRQDLEDTLWVGVAVVQVVRETMQSMKETLSLPAQRACVGSDFEDNLVRAEEAIAEIRQLYEVARKAGALD